MGKDLVWVRTEAKAGSRGGKPPAGWWRWNIRNPYNYAKHMAKQVRKWEGKVMSPSRLKLAIEEDSYQSISIADCKAIMRKAGL